MRSARVLRRKTTLMRNRAAPLALAVGLLTASLPARAVIVSTDDDEVIDGIPFRNDDLVALDETPGSAELWLDGATVFADDPLGDANLDALAFLPGGNVLLSTASSSVIGGLAVKDGDLVELDLETGIATLFLQEGAQGQPVDVDGVDVLSNGHLLLSFQKEEVLDGQPVHDGDVIEYDIESNTFTFFLSENEIFDVDSDVNGLALLPNGNLAITTTDDTWIGGLLVETSEIAEIDLATGVATILLDLEPRAGVSDVDLIAFEPTACNDGVDNDGDGYLDGKDAGCSGQEDDSERDPSAPCDDGIDNDGDGFVDASPVPGVGDPGCVTPLAPTESPECQDGIDNQGDGTLDYDGGLSALGAGSPGLGDPDPTCTGLAWRPREGWPLCGLGFELVFLLVPLLVGRQGLARVRPPRS
jgi:hypothetical protein